MKTEAPSSQCEAVNHDEASLRKRKMALCSDRRGSLFFCLLQRGSLTQIPVVKETRVESGQFLLLSVLCMLFILVVLAVSTTFFCVRQRSHLRMKEKLASLGTDTSTDATATYQVRPTLLSLSQSGGCNTSLGRDWRKINSYFLV